MQLDTFFFPNKRTQNIPPIEPGQPCPGATNNKPVRFQQNGHSETALCFKSKVAGHFFCSAAMTIALLLACGCGVWKILLQAMPIPPSVSSIETTAGFDLGADAKLLTANGSELMAKEALHWMQVLLSIEDASLPSVECAQKYQDLSMAASILSSTSSGVLRQRFWSAQAVDYGLKSIQMLADSPKLQPARVLNEANTRLLMAMGLNYLQDGGIEGEEIAGQYQQIDKSFLVENGFSKNKILRALEDRKIIQLPNYFSEVNI